MWNIVLLHMRDMRRRGTLLERLGELRQRLHGALRDHFDGAVGQISGGAAEPEPPGRLPDEPPEPHTLHPAVHHEARGGHARYSWPRCAVRRRCHQTYTATTPAKIGRRISSARPA